MMTRVIIIFLIFIFNTILACGTCYGDPNSSAVDGMNWAIISLLVTTGGVLSGISFSIFSIAKKAKKYNKSKEV
tara:strand:+ start:198 stop:419 length:222 start_codon:yes stop_codon:yes gene_type:complete